MKRKLDWPAVVGPELSKHSRFVGVYDNVGVVEIAPSVKSMFSFLAQAIAREIGVRKIRLRIARGGN